MADEIIRSDTNSGAKSIPTPAKKQRIVVVLGMHRSGTSLLTNLLSVLGVDPGTDLMAANSGNELGYWENNKIYRVQDALLNHIAKDWGDLGFAFPFAIDWNRLPEFRSFQDQLAAIVRSEVANAKGIFGFKDPRTCRLLPMWKQIFAELNLEPLYVLALRNPADVSESLLKRNRFDPFYSELLWLLHTLEAVRDAGSELRMVVDYDRWFTSPREQAQAVAKALELPWPSDDSELDKRLAETIRGDLRHSQARHVSSLPFVVEAYEMLQRAAVRGRALNEAETQFASKCLEATLELSIGSGKTASELGHSELLAGNYETALVAFTRAACLQPRLASAHAGRASALQLLGRYAEALVCVRQALLLDPKEPVALNLLVRLNPQVRSRQTSPAVMPPVKRADLPRPGQGLNSRQKITVGILSLDENRTACAYLRLLSPLNYLRGQGRIEFLPLCELANGRVNLNQANFKLAQVVVVQRGMPVCLPFQTLRAALKDSSVKIVYELDDALTLVPKDHPAFAYYDSMRPRIEEYLRNADLVTVSTPQLKEIYSHFNNHIEVLPNSIDSELWQSSLPKVKHDNKVRILFSGTLNHQQDLALIEPAMDLIIQQFRDEVEFLFWGNFPAGLRQKLQVKSIAEFTPDYRQYVERLKTLDIDLALVPLTATPFNRTKSNIKWLEYSACKIPAIFTDLDPYNQSVEHGKTGWLVPNTIAAWHGAMKTMIMDEKLRRSVAENAHQRVLEKHSLVAHADLWLQAYEKARALPVEPIRSGTSAPVAIPDAKTQSATHSPAVVPTPANTESTEVERIYARLRAYTKLFENVCASAPAIPVDFGRNLEFSGHSVADFSEPGELERIRAEIRNFA